MVDIDIYIFVDSNLYSLLNLYQLPSNALGPQLVRMASDFELLTTKGDEYGPVLLDEAMRRIKADERFDPELVEAFWAALGVYPVGSTVALSRSDEKWHLCCKPIRFP